MGSKNNSYLDYAATTPVDARVLSAMTPYFTRVFGNPSSVHRYGQEADAGLEEARARVAQALNASSKEIVFTSCGSESDNLALRGVAMHERKTRGADTLLTTAVEHGAVLNTAQQLSDEYGFILKIIPVDEYGMVKLDELARLLTSNIAMVSVIYANNEIGTINPIAKIGQMCREARIPFHTDAVQAAAHLPIDVRVESIDLMSIGAHKLYGPKGVGALFVRDGIQLLPSQSGGGQENGRRAGTQNVPYIVGLAEALSLAKAEQAERSHYLRPLRDEIIGKVLEEIPDTRLTGHPTLRLPNHASFAFKGVDGNLLLMLLNEAGFSCSSGSACKTGSPEPSGVLTAIGLDREWALGSLRVTLGKDTKQGEVTGFLNALPDLVDRARSLR
jgi:cysteine desulfurase